MKSIEEELFGLIEIRLGERPFDAREISSALASENSLVKLTALDLLRDNYRYDLTSRVLALVFDPDKKVAAKAADTITRDPLFAFEQRPEFTDREVPDLHAGAKPGRVYLENLFSKERKSALSALVKEIPEEDFVGALEDFARLPGVGNLELEDIFAGDGEIYREEFNQFRSGYFLDKYTPQVAVAPSFRCNLNCSYCYANDLNSAFPEDMTLEQFKELLDVLNPDNIVKRVSFIGGEPLIFPRLPQFIRELTRRGLDFYFATNGIIEPAIFDQIVQQTNLLSATVHVEKDDFYSPDKLEKLLINVRNLGERNIDTIIRYNLMDPAGRDWDFLVKYMEMLPEFKFSFAVVFPSQSGRGDYVKLENLEAFSQKIIAMISFLKEKAGEKSFRAVFAKPYPPCFFTEEELKFILNNVEYKNVCEIDKNSYTNNICINPDLSYFPCVALTDPAYRGEKIKPFEEMKIENKARAGFLVHKALLEECGNCRLFHLGVCQAACYAYVRQHEEKTAWK